MLLAMVVSSIGSGQLISRTGRYKVILLGGLALMAAGYLMITTFDINTTNQTLVEAMILIGLGLGCTMQTYTLVVQNSVSRADLAVATSATQLSRSMGSALGLAIMGTILTQGLAAGMAKYLPASVLRQWCEHRLRVRPDPARSSAGRDRGRNPSRALRRAPPGVRGRVGDDRARVRRDPLHPRGAPAPDGPCGGRTITSRSGQERRDSRLN
jgi:hypothetical protein